MSDDKPAVTTGPEAKPDEKPAVAMGQGAMPDVKPAVAMGQGAMRDERPVISGQGPSGFSMKAPDFSGEGSFSRFSADLKTFYAIHAFNDDLKLRFLPLCLTGVARDAFEALSTDSRSSFDKAMHGLSESFGKPCALDAHARLRNLKFDSSMPLDAFVIRFKQLMTEAFPGQLGDQVLFHTFLPTLPTKYQEHIIAQGIGSFEEAVQKVRNLIQSERFHQPVRQVSAPQSRDTVENKLGSDVLEQILQRIEAIERRMKDEVKPQRRSSGGRRVGAQSVSGGPALRACFCCGSTDHLRVSCPVRDGFCAHCGRRGHTVDVCWNRGNGQGAGDSGGVDRRSQ